MKKIVAIVAAALVCFSMQTPCFAVSKGEIMSDIEGGIVVNGKVVHAPSNYVSMAQTYLNSHDLTDAQLTRILNAVESEKEKVKRQMEAEGYGSGGSSTSSEPTKTSSSNASNSSGQQTQNTNGNPSSGQIMAGGTAGTTYQAPTTSAAQNTQISESAAQNTQTSDSISNSIIQSMGLGNKKLTPGQKLALSNAAIEVAKSAGATVTTNNKDVVIVDKNGNTYNTNQLNPIKVTGVAYSFIPALIVAAVMTGIVFACGLMLRHLKNNYIGEESE